MQNPMVEVDRRRLGSMGVILTITLLAVYVFDLPRLVGGAALIGLLLLLLGGYGWRFKVE
jgi:hypothetical protein